MPFMDELEQAERRLHNLSGSPRRRRGDVLDQFKGEPVFDQREAEKAVSLRSRPYESGNKVRLSLKLDAFDRRFPNG